MTKPSVWVIHDTGTINTFPAKRFGDLQVCVEGHVDAVDTDIAIQQIRERMVDVKSGDYLLPIGSPTLIAIAAIEMARRAGSLRVLQWDRENRQYHTMEVSSV